MTAQELAAVTWDVMICAIPHRYGKLVRLLEELDRQRQPGFGALINYTQPDHDSYGPKVQAMLNASRADYVSCLDDDDWVHPEFVSVIMDALQERPDYVGFQVRWTADGQLRLPVSHSLRYAGWQDDSSCLYRDITQFNPVRRELAMLGTWEGGYEAERRWSDQVRATGRVKKEHLILDEMYWYRESTGDTFLTKRLPFLHGLPALPEYDWLVPV